MKLFSIRFNGMGLLLAGSSLFAARDLEVLYALVGTGIITSIAYVFIVWREASEKPRSYSPRIAVVATESIGQRHQQHELAEELCKHIDSGEHRFVKELFATDTTRIGARHICSTLGEIVNASSHEARNAIYSCKARESAKEVLERGLNVAGWRPVDIDMLISVSCTGYMVPSLDVFLSNALGLRPDVKRLPIMQLGCNGIASAVQYATHFLQARPRSRAAIVGVELPSTMLNIQPRGVGQRKVDMVTASLFADSAACLLLAGYQVLPESEPEGGWNVVGAKTVLIRDSIDKMGMRITNRGWDTILALDLAAVIERTLKTIVIQFLRSNHTTVRQLDHILVHPGGRKILESAERALGRGLPESWAVLAGFGNLSSCTVPFLIREVMRKEAVTGKRVLVVAFGPGVSVELTLLEGRRV